MKAAGATPRDIVKLTYFVVDYDAEKRIHARVMEEFLGGHRPTSTLVEVKGLARKGWLFEVEAVAAVGGLGESASPTLSSSPDVGDGGVKGGEVDVVVVGGGLSGLQVSG